MEITAWYDEAKRAKALENVSEIYYYMVHATRVEERRNWAIAYTKLLQHECSHIDVEAS